MVHIPVTDECRLWTADHPCRRIQRDSNTPATVEPRPARQALEGCPPPPAASSLRVVPVDAAAGRRVALPVHPQPGVLTVSTTGRRLAASATTGAMG